MRLSSSVVASSAAAVLATVLLCGPAASQITPGSAPSLPGVTVDAPKQATKLQRSKTTADTGILRRTRSTASSTARAPSVASDSVEARIAKLERAASSCNGGCETSFKSGNAPWVGCSLSGQEFSHFDTTCSDTLRYKHYADCAETKAFLGWDRNKVWLHCSSLLAGGKFQVAEIKRLKRAQ